MFSSICAPRNALDEETLDLEREYVRWSAGGVETSSGQSVRMAKCADPCDTVFSGQGNLIILRSFWTWISLQSWGSRSSSTTGAGTRRWVLTNIFLRETRIGCRSILSIYILAWYRAYPTDERRLPTSPSAEARRELTAFSDEISTLLLEPSVGLAFSIKKSGFLTCLRSIKQVLLS